MGGKQGQRGRPGTGGGACPVHEVVVCVVPAPAFRSVHDLEEDRIAESPCAARSSPGSLPSSRSQQRKEVAGGAARSAETRKPRPVEVVDSAMVLASSATPFLGLR